MEDMETHEHDNICDYVLSRYSNSMQDDHQHLCAVMGTMSQELKDQRIPLTSIAYFGAISASLNRLCLDSKPSNSTVTALLTLQSIILPKISPAMLRKSKGFASEPVLRVLRSESAPIDAITSGLKCVSHLLVVGDKVTWSEISHLYDILLSFICDSRPKVRNQSHHCLHAVLQSFQRSSVLAPASQGITNILERLLLLVDKTKASHDSSKGKREAHEILYLLDAFKHCLPLISPKFIIITLKQFKSLLERHQPHVTRLIINCLSALCLHPTSEVAYDVLLDLLCSLASSASLNEKSVDDMKLIARLLDAGIRKVYLLNRQACIVKLPVVFHSLAEIFGCEHEEALFATMEAMKSLILACIDDELVKQGVDQIKVNGDSDVRKSGPTIIEKICATIDSLLGYQYNKAWVMAFQVVSTMFDKLGENSVYLLKVTLKNLADMQKLTDSNLPCRKQMHECVGSALSAMGPENFLSILPLNLGSDDLSEVNVWLFPILKQYMMGACLSFFLKSILAMVESMKQKSLMFKQEGKIFSSRAAEALIYTLWSLFPAFCNYPQDTADCFKALENPLCGVLRDEPDVCGIICSSLQILIQQNKRLLDSENDLLSDDMSMSEKRVRAHYTKLVAANNLSVLKSSSGAFLSALCDTFLKSSNCSGSLVKSTIGEFSSISDKAVVKRFFGSITKEILKMNEETAKGDHNSDSMLSDRENKKKKKSSLVAARAQRLDLSASFLPGLDVEDVDYLFSVIKLGLQDDESMIQRKSYKILSIILTDRIDFLSAKCWDLLQLLGSPKCRNSLQASALRHRLDCLYSLLVHVAEDTSELKKHDIINSFLFEIIPAVRERNKKTRNRAYDILVKIGHAYRDEAKGGTKEKLERLFCMVTVGLYGEYPPSVCAAIKGVARLVYEFSDLFSASYGLLPIVWRHFHGKNQEIIKANLGLMKVLLAKSQPEWLQTNLKSVVEGLLRWQNGTMNSFKAKVKVLLEILVKRCGIDAVKVVMPEEHMKLLSNIRKIRMRKERRNAANSEVDARSLHSKATTTRLSRWNHTKIFSDIGDEDSEDSDVGYLESMASGKSRAASRFTSNASTLRSKQAQKMAKNLPEDLFNKMEDDPLDLLDRQGIRSALQSSVQHKRKQESDDEPEIDSEGRLVIHEEGRKKREICFNLDTDAESDLGSGDFSTKSATAGTRRKRKKTSESGWSHSGSEYGSKKAGGDMKRKDKLEPYAYWPLDRKMMSRRPEHRAAARKGMANVVKLTKKLEGKSTWTAISMNKGLFKRNGGNGRRRNR